MDLLILLARAFDGSWLSSGTTWAESSALLSEPVPELLSGVYLVDSGSSSLEPCILNEFSFKDLVMNCKFFIATLVLAAFAGCQSNNESPKLPEFPVQLNCKVEIPEEDDGIEVRLNYFSSETGLITHREIEYKNGVTGYEFYAENGNIKEVKELYPAPSDAELRNLKLSLIFDPSQDHLLYQRSYRPDGTPDMDGRLRADNYYESNQYYEDGKSIRENVVYDLNNQVWYRNRFRSGGTKSYAYRWLEADCVGEEIDYRDDETIKWITRRPKHRYGAIERDVYAEDGETCLMKVEYRAHAIEVTYLDSESTVLERRIFNNAGEVQVTHYNSEGVPYLRQVWKGVFDRDNWFSIDDKYLFKVYELQADGKVTREIRFNRDSRIPRLVFLPDHESENEKSGTYRRFYRDGRLRREIYKDGEGHQSEVVNFDEEDNIFEELPDSLFVVLQARVHPPMIDKMPIIPHFPGGFF